MDFSTTFSRWARWQFIDFGDFEFFPAHLPEAQNLTRLSRRLSLFLTFLSFLRADLGTIQSGQHARGPIRFDPDIGPENLDTLLRVKD
jgi:hypothetical protein